MTSTNVLMYTINEALCQLSADNRVYACDNRRRDGSIGKAFLCLNDTQFKKTVDSGKYGWHFYEILLVDRPCRIFVDVETDNGDYNMVRQGVDNLVKLLNQMLITQSLGGIEHDFTILDSSNDKKISFHVIGGPYLKNLFHVGALIRKISCYIHAVRNEIDDVKTFFDYDGNSIIDERVYTTNRQFRLAEMSKLGSDRVLKGCTWFASLLQTTDPLCTRYECLEVDGSEPFSTSRSATEMFKKIDGNWCSVISSTHRVKTICATIPESLRMVVQSIEVEGGYLNGTNFNVSTGCYTLSSTSKHCAIAGREHRGNHIFYVLNPWKRSVVQRCFDDNCRSEVKALHVPKEAWERWTLALRQEVNIGDVI